MNNRSLEQIMKWEISYVGFEDLTAVVMKSSTFWDIRPRVVCLMSTDLSEKHVASMFRVDE
jgi:hypothetical protein